MFNKKHKKESRNLTVARFQPKTEKEYLIYEIAKAIQEHEVRFLMSIADRYGYEVIERAWTELRHAMNDGVQIRSYKRLLNHLIQKQIKIQGNE